MRKVFSAATIVAIITCGSAFGGGGRVQRARDRREQQKVERVESRVELGLDYAQVASLKLASLKPNYRLGEFISLDVAMLNVSTAPLYFRELSKPVVKGHDEKGVEIRVHPYLEVYRMANPNSYTLIQPGRFITSSVQVLVGCDKRAFERFDRSKDQQSDYQRFENDSFLNWGHACLNVKLPGTYTLTIEQDNQFVIVGRSRPAIRTAVGTIRSTPLTIRVLAESKE